MSPAVGGTFQPVRVGDVREHHAKEWLNVGAALVEQVRATRARGGRVVAVGTTVVRALESAMGEVELQPFAGETQIFIFPGYRFSSVDALLTNFHLPESTLLMLVSAFAGKERVFAAYAHAVREGYRFFPMGMRCCCFRGYEMSATNVGGVSTPTACPFLLSGLKPLPHQRATS